MVGSPAASPSGLRIAAELSLALLGIFTRYNSISMKQKIVGAPSSSPLLEIIPGLFFGTVLVVTGSVAVVKGSVVVITGSVVVITGSEVVVSGSDVVVSGSEVVVSGSEVVVSGSDVVVSGSVVVVTGSVVVVSVVVPTGLPQPAQKLPPVNAAPHLVQKP